MKQLTGVDASFLYMETPNMFGHVSGLAVFRRGGDPDWSAYDAVRNRIQVRLPDLEPFTRRLVEVPLRLDHPYWIKDPDFDLEYHVRHTAVPPPGTDAKLADLVARIIAIPLDRRHPLWECWVIEGLDDGRFAVLVKIHHATIDGAAGAELMRIFYDTEPSQASGPGVVPAYSGEHVPNSLEILARTVAQAVVMPGRLAGLQVRTLRALGELTRNRGLTGLAELARTLPNPIGARLPGAPRRDPDGDGPAPVPSSLSAPPTPFNRAITGHRRIALRAVPLDDVKAIKQAAGSTVNDVVMAVCAGALRNYLLHHDALPDVPLVAAVPVSIRTGEETSKWTNRVSAMFPALPTHLEDPEARLRAVAQVMNEAKDRFGLVPADVLTEYAQFAPPALAMRAARVASRFRLADRVRLPFNLVISNVPGPRQPLYLGPAQLEHYYPVSAVAETQGLNMTVQSYCGTLDFGLVGCRELVPDLDLLADFAVDEIAVLAKAFGA